ncbi:MAG: hypothetical protein HDR17_00020 [Lachnospiraceae bacterium]|nr:hypothetical protein [Lachnospiraceae bacterium]
MIRTGEMALLKQIHTSPHCLAYLDILGAKNLMSKESEKFLNDLNSIYFNAFHSVALTNRFDKREIFFKIFSDNILLAINLKDNNTSRKTKIETILNLVGNIFNDALRHGYLLRGAITEGEFFQNDIFVYGKALLEAIKLEEEIAIYPRIIAQETIKEALPQYFYESADGLNVLDSFIFALFADNVSFKMQLLAMLRRYYNDMKARQKILWSLRYFNDYFERSGKIDAPQNLKITDEEIANAMRGASV